MNEPAATAAPAMPTSHEWKRALLGWLAMAGAMTANGNMREKLLRPFMGERTANALSATSGIVIIQLISRQTLHRTTMTRRERLLLASLWLSMTVGFETAVGRWVDKKSWEEIVAHYLRRGELWPLVLASLGVAPFVWGRPQ